MTVGLTMAQAGLRVKESPESQHYAGLRRRTPAGSLAEARLTGVLYGIAG